MLNIDLHSHSRVSDGVLGPADLVRRACDNGVKVLALTDHDEVAGVTEAKRTASEMGIELVSGVEISITWAGTSIHIVGLQVDEKDPVLVDMLRRNRMGRMERAQRMGERFAELGVEGAYEGALKYVTKPDFQKAFCPFSGRNRCLPDDFECFRPLPEGWRSCLYPPPMGDFDGSGPVDSGCGRNGCRRPSGPIQNQGCGVIRVSG
jgi:predicted metal-dependent phosphoesterase TrpH